MPTETDRQKAANALHQAFLVNFLAEIEARVMADDDFSDDDTSSDESDASSHSHSSSNSTTSWDDSSPSSGDSSDSSSDDSPTAAEHYVEQMGDLFSERYLVEREPIPKTQELMHLILHEYKYNRPKFFRSYLRITPACFDALVAAIEDDEIFHNNSNNAQMPVPEQLVIALYRLGHYGNAASNLKVALQFGVGFGTVHLVTTRVIRACCSTRFRAASVQWSSAEAKEAAKQWVEDRSCPAWRNGWLMVDGTLVPLFRRPGFYGNVWFDRKSNYSLNVQLISTPDCHIIDYVIGLPGSQHDATAWEETLTAKQHERLLGEDEWVWADSAYPLQKWCQSPYKKPEKLLDKNGKYNYRLSAIRVRSEHCVGWLKGRWSSLKQLRVSINGEKGIQYATLWIMACIHLHAFALKHEGGQYISRDRFYKKGRKYRRRERRKEKMWRRERRRRNTNNEQERDEAEEIALLDGKIKREELKEQLFEYLREVEDMNLD